MRLTSKSSIAD